jgi:hypothetical protein
VRNRIRHLLDRETMQYIKIRDKDTGLFSIGFNAFDFIPLNWSDNPIHGEKFYFLSDVKEHLKDNKKRYELFPNLELVFYKLVEDRSESIEK